MKIRFNVPPVVGNELAYIEEAINNGRLSGHGEFTKRCHSELKKITSAGKVLLTPSCTDALEMAAILAGVEPGDEVIMPSYTFVSTANAFVLRGATPVFVDIEETTLNLNPVNVEKAITDKTKAIVPVHYAGVGCDMKALTNLAQQYDLKVIEDAAQAIMSDIHGQPLGSFGDLAALSFHETKNIVSGEGGALLINNETLYERSEILWEKGTNRSQFFRGQVDKYTWVDVGSSFLPSELQAAFLLAQLEKASEITQKRLSAWTRYQQQLTPLEMTGKLRLPIIPDGYIHNAHMFYVLLNTKEEQKRVLKAMADAGINAVFHYQPLHSAPAGKVYGKTNGSLSVTDDISERLVRLPLYADISTEQVDYVCNVMTQVWDQ